MASSAGLELGLVALEQSAEAAYAFVVYAEALGQELASLPKGTDATLLHLLFEGIQRFLSDALGSAAGSVVFEQSIEAISPVSLPPASQLPAAVAKHLGELKLATG